VANIRSQIKRNKQNERARLRNKAVRSQLKTRTKSAVSSAEANTDEQLSALREAVRHLDIAASKGVIHRNQAANRKSGLVKRISAIAAAR